MLLSKLPVQIYRILGSDLCYILFSMLLAVSTSQFCTVGAPLDISRFRQVIYYDLSRNFRPSVNSPANIVMISTFCIFGLLKVLYAVSFFKQSKTLFWMYLVQGFSFAMLAVLNEDVSSFVHVTFTVVLLVITMVLIHLRLKQSGLTSKIKQPLHLALTAIYTVLITIAAIYSLSLLALKGYEEIFH